MYYNNTIKTPFRQIERTTATAGVAGQLRRAMLDGDLRRGEKLPTEQRLAETFSVSRVVIREALKELKGSGLIEPARRGRHGGPVVGGIDPDKAAEVLSDHLRLQDVSVSSLVEFRVLVESGAALWAATRRSAPLLERMGGLIERMSKPGLSWQAYHDLDVAFHLAVTEASGNPCATVVMRAIREAMERAMVEGFRRAKNPSALRDAMIVEHRKIYELIAAGRDRAAERLVRRHILDFYERLFPSELQSRRRVGATAASRSVRQRSTPRRER